MEKDRLPPRRPDGRGESAAASPGGRTQATSGEVRAFLDQGGEAPEGEVDEEDQSHEHRNGPRVDYLSRSLGSHAQIKNEFSHKVILFFVNLPAFQTQDICQMF